jgi:hypothetical protein
VADRKSEVLTSLKELRLAPGPDDKPKSASRPTAHRFSPDIGTQES